MKLMDMDFEIDEIESFAEAGELFNNLFSIIFYIIFAAIIVSIVVIAIVAGKKHKNTTQTIKEIIAKKLDIDTEEDTEGKDAEDEDIEQEDEGTEITKEKTKKPKKEFSYCDYCGGIIEDTDKKCPHCGAHKPMQ